MVQPVDDGWTEKRPLIDACRKRARSSKATHLLDKEQKKNQFDFKIQIQFSNLRPNLT